MADQITAAELASVLSTTGLGDGTPDLGDAAPIRDPFTASQLAHMWLMAIGWGVVIPVGIVIARSFKPQGAWWLAAHRATQSLGLALGLVGLAMGFVANQGWQTDQPVHRDLGIAATSLALAQMVSLMARPRPGQQYRGAWGYCHAWMGRSAAVLAIANIYYGILKVGELGAWAWAAYTAVLGAVVLVAACKDLHDFLERRRDVSDDPPRDVAAPKRRTAKNAGADAPSSPSS